MSPIAIAPPTTFAAIVVFAKNIVSQILIGNVIKRSYSFPSLFARLCLFEQFVRDAIKHPVGNGLATNHAFIAFSNIFVG